MDHSLSIQFDSLVDFITSIIFLSIYFNVKILYLKTFLRIQSFSVFDNHNVLQAKKTYHKNAIITMIYVYN